MKPEHRRDKRSRVFLTARLRSADGEVEVKLTNLSGLGACADFPVILMQGAAVQILRGDMMVPARIAWAAEGKLGIEFDHPLNVAQFRAQGQALSDPVLTPLYKPVERLSPRLERHWAKIWNR